MNPADLEAFFGRPVLEVAPDLLGSRISHAGVTVDLTEVEAYAGTADPASHAFRGRTGRNAVMFGPAGRVYVYFSYGVHWCANLVCGVDGVASAVLLRSGRVVCGEPAARERRGMVAADRLAQGPGNLASALGLVGALTGTSLVDGPVGWSPRTASATDVRQGPRVGVSRAADEPWRFWFADDPTVSSYRRSPRA